MPNEDLSDEAILERYKKATMMAVVTSNRMLFSSLMDIFSLVAERKQMRKRIAELEEKLNAKEGPAPTT
jgi:hypothetical protein